VIVSTLACLGLAADQGEIWKVLSGGLCMFGTAVKDISSFACHVALFLLRLFDSWTSSFSLVYLWVRFMWG
jgi:hypothetical protein